MMAPSPNVQNSFGAEVVAYEHIQHAAPQAREPYNPLYFVDDHTPPVPDSFPEEKPASNTPKRKILGLSGPIFWLVIVVAVLLVLGTGIGVGVGVSQSRSPSSSTPTSTTGPEPGDPQPEDSEEESSTPADEPTSTSSAPVTSGTTGLADNSCTSRTPSTYTSSDGTHFTQFCFTDWPAGGDAADGEGEVEDLERLTLYTFEDCMEACIEYNEDLGQDEEECLAVTYNSNLTSIIAVGRQGGNCFLKNKRGEDHTGSAESACAAIAR